MAPHSSTLAWKIPWMEEPDGLQSMGSLKVGHDLVTEQQFIDPRSPNNSKTLYNMNINESLQAERGEGQR